MTSDKNKFNRLQMKFAEIMYKKSSKHLKVKVQNIKITIKDKKINKFHIKKENKMQSSTRHTISASNLQSSTFVVRTNGQQSVGKTIVKEIEAQSSSSVDMQAKEKQELLMRVLMMSFEIERKDMVVKNLIKDIEGIETRNSLTSNEQIYTIKQQLQRTRRQIEQMQHKIIQLQMTNSHLSLNKNTVSKQLQQKVNSLQHKNKQLQIKKIQLESQLHKVHTQTKMMNFRLVNVESTQKGKNREMQSMVMDLQKRVQQERKISNEFKIVIQSTHEEIRMLRENQQKLCRQFDQRLKYMQKDHGYKEDLKRSQAVNSQQKIQMTQHQLIRMQDEVKFLRKTLDEQRVLFERKEGEMLGDIKRGKEMEAELFRLRHASEVMRANSQAMRTELEQRVNQVNSLVKELNEARTAYNQLQESRELSSIETANTYQHQLSIIQHQTATYRQRIHNLQQELDRYKVESRKLKRRSQNNINTECASCKILQSATSIKSHKMISELNLNEIIQQTERLHDSSLKMEQILSSRRIVLPVGGYDSRMSIDNSFVNQ